MHHRALAAMALTAAIAALGFAPAAANAQSAEAPAPARTAWGDPDLQGIWNNATLTPFQRPEALGDQEFLTEEAAASLEQQSAERNAALWEAPARRTEAGGNVGAYNNFWMERGTTVVPTRRTSMIVDPPNGRLPEVTPEVAAWLASPEADHRWAVRRGNAPADSYEQLDLGDRCIWYRGIPSFPTGYNNNYHILQNPDFVVILQEHIHDVRYIPLDGARTFPRPSASTAATRAAAGRGRRWSSRPRTSTTRRSSATSTMSS